MVKFVVFIVIPAILFCVTCLFSDIEWSRSFESIRAKIKFSFLGNSPTTIEKISCLNEIMDRVTS